MKKTIYDFERKYKVQNRLLNTGSFEGLDERTLHETIKAMLINTTKDCIKYENRLDSEMKEISQIIIKKEKTKDDIRKQHNVQDRLRTSLHFAEISENSLTILLHQILSSDDIKHAFKQEIPEVYNNIYYMIELEDNIAESIAIELSESYEELSYKQICEIINNCIKDMIANAEEYIEGIQDHELYDQFVSFREKSRNKEKENANE